ncbi:centromere protein F isoform X2 [Triplophysa dalaica]|uniref:centromere protein F isoform X2 n=1 Tax=Triplophysa dalaica TaxID=1582913 RepID=UPI0024DF39AA|nr:centromere protein F isoform X2 [Triplophysa dalaica]
MSWPGEDWTVGLTGHVLQKVKQLQAQNEKLTKERQQRQLQLDNSEAALHKQKQKHEEVRVDLNAVQRELGGVREAAQAEVRVRERLAHDLQVKTGQVHSLEGQLESSKILTQNLTQEIKRLEAELEKLQKGNGSGDSMLFSTPCWNMSSPWDNSGGFRAEGDGKAQHVRQQLQFGEIPKPVAGGASSAFPQQPQKSPPIRRHTRQSEASTPSSMFPWERDDLRSTPKGRPAPCVSSGDVIKSNDSGIEEALRNEIDALRVRVSELQREALLESERLKDVDSRLAQAQRDINTKEQSLTRTQDQLTRAQTRITEETDRVHAVEQKVKHLQEELKCQRQNAESSRCNAEQRRKDMEREHQRELLEQQRERQALEKQHQQEINRLNQEIQQARTLLNTLQAQHDKVCLQKQGLERDLEDVKGKLKNTEADLKESQKRETQTEAKLTEALRENENLTVSLVQVKKQEKALQEEVKRLTDELAEALKLIKELQAQLAVPPQPVSVPHFGSTGDCLSPSVSFQHDRSLPYQPSTQRKRAPQTGRTREEERMKYPSGREPGEGIDSEHIGSSGSEESHRFRGKGVDAQQSCSLKRSDTDVDISLTEQDTGIEDVDTDSFMSDSTLSTRSISESGITRNLQDVTHDTTGNVEKHETASLKDLKKENSRLRDELKDVNYELQKRLDDLESQRRAEAEARTKLKQLSRKHSTQTEQQRAKALELKDSMAKLEAQLEQETKEVTKLRENLDVLEREAEKRQDEKEREQDESAERMEVLAEMERKEEEMERMRKELEDLQRKLEQEREEREQEREEERKKIRKEEAEGLKIAQLQEELDNLRRFGQLEDNISKENFPVAYLQLDRHTNTNNKDSPESICDSVNLHNTMICQKSRAVELIVDLGAQTNLGTTTEGKTEIEEPLAVSLDDTTGVVLEMERMRVERDQEAENAKLAQRKLEDLQKQVNTQTNHLTHAFESQSKNIENLLRELHNKECALQRQAEELQKCQKKITLLEESRADREDVVFGEVSIPPEPSTEISRELSCDSVISNMSISDQEMSNDDTQQILKDSSLQLPVEHSVSRNIEQTTTTDASDKIQIATEAFNPHELNCECPTSSSHNSEGLEHSQVFTESAQEIEKLSVTSSRPLDKQVQTVSEKDDSELERVTKELQEAENQLNVMKTQNETLGLVNEELLSVKRENEESKAKLRGLEKDTCADRTSKEDQNNQKLNEEGFLDGSSSGLEESVVPDDNSEDKGIEATNEKVEVHDLHKQIQTLQEQIQNLSEQNRTQAEELNLWKISAMGATVDSSSPSITLREFEIFLPCNSIKPCTQQKRTTDMTHQCGSEDGKEQTNLPETQITHAQGAAEVLLTENENETMIKENAQECAASSVNYKDETPPDCTSHTTTTNNKDGLSDLQQIALLSPVSHGNTTGAGANSQKDALINISILSEYQTKVINTEPITKSREIHDSQNSDLGTARNQMETKETDALDKHGDPYGGATDKQNNHHVAEEVSASQTSESSKGQRAESDKINGDGNRTEVREVQSVSTQTEESEELSDTTVKRSLVHTGTQTDTVQLETDEEEGHEGSAESVPLSRTLQTVTNQLLLSKAFPMSDPAHLAERIRQNRNRMSAAYDDTEYEPYGLPEVVMKGFADIPSGPACPYVLRRGLLGTDAMPLPLKEAKPQEDEDIEP